MLGCQGEPAVSPEVGKWRAAEPETVAIKALPYAQGYQAPIDQSTGVVVYDTARAQAGFNLVVSGHASEARLVDMTGRMRHRWGRPVVETFAELAGTPGIDKVDYWRRAALLPDGSIVAIYEGNGLAKLDRASRVSWALRGDFHHDLWLAPDGSMLVLDRQGGILPRINPSSPVLEDFITHVSAAGSVIQRFSVLEAFEKSEFKNLLTSMPREGDLLHTNTLEVLDGSLAPAIPAFRRGNLLVSVLTISTLAVIDPERKTVVWAMQGGWRKQHQPSVIGGSKLLLFDNTGIDRDHSRVIEIDPRDGRIVWQFGGQPHEDLFSRTLGSVQRLPNGNTLITESERGRAIEVTPDRKVVWEYRSPYRVFMPEELVAVLLEVVRLPAEAVKEL